MRNRVLKYIITIAAIAFLGYNSVYLRKLDEVKWEPSSNNFDPENFARSFYHDRLLPHADSALEVNTLISLLNTDPDNTFKQHSRAAAIGNIRFFLVRGEGTIAFIGEDATTVQLKNSQIKSSIHIVTEFVYGNSIRDASGLVNLNDFGSSSDFNNISESLNKLIRTEVLPQFRKMSKQGMNMRFTGAVELNQKYMDLDTIEVVPIRLSIIK